MVRSKRILLGACLSGVLHTALLTALLRHHPEWINHSDGDLAAAFAQSEPLAVAMVPSSSLSTEAVLPVLEPGDAEHFVLHPSAPSNVPNPDPRAGSVAASSGDGAGRPAFSFTGRRDRDEMRAQLYDADVGYQMQRIRTAPDRSTREEVRATPHPGATPDLASLRGKGHARHPSGAPRVGDDLDQAPWIGVLTPGVAAAEFATPTVAGDQSTRGAGRTHAEAQRAQHRIGKDGDEAVGFARPALAQGLAATDAARRSDQVADRVDSALVSNELHPGPIELSHPAPIGLGDGGGGAGDRPSGARAGQGNEVAPAGDARAPHGDALAVATYRRNYNLYLSDVKRRVDPLWELPREMVVALEQGDVLISFTIRRDGQLRDVHVVKSSGFPKFDANVVGAIRKAAPFAPLPPVFGQELRIVAPFDGANPVVR